MPLLSDSGDGFGSIPDSLPSEATGLGATLNRATGTLGKFFDTALDQLAIQGVGKLIGTTYPTGQQNPAALAAQNSAVAAQSPFNYRPWIIGGSIALGSILAIAVAVRLSSK